MEEYWDKLKDKVMRLQKFNTFVIIHVFEDYHIIEGSAGCAHYEYFNGEWNSKNNDCIIRVFHKNGQMIHSSSSICHSMFSDIFDSKYSIIISDICRPVRSVSNMKYLPLDEAIDELQSGPEREKMTIFWVGDFKFIWSNS